jgi:cytochrome b6-f complex iron-sulfur subunit
MNLGSLQGSSGRVWNSTDKFKGTLKLQPIENKETNQMRRRSFINYCLSTSLAAVGGFAVYAFGKYLFPPSSFSAEAGTGTVQINLADLPVGTAKFFRYKGQPSVAIRTSEKSVSALSAVCTHLGCIVKWDDGKRLFVCPCHAAMFDVNGNVVGGPAPRPLPNYPTRIAQDEVVIGEA